MFYEDVSTQYKVCSSEGEDQSCSDKYAADVYLSKQWFLYKYPFD